jgi:hypothetical protein
VPYSSFAYSTLKVSVSGCDHRPVEHQLDLVAVAVGDVDRIDQVALRLVGGVKSEPSRLLCEYAHAPVQRLGSERARSRRSVVSSTSVRNGT